MLGDQSVSKQLWYHPSLIRMSALAQFIETLENWSMAATPKVAIFLIAGVGLFVRSTAVGHPSDKWVLAQSIIKLGVPAYAVCMALSR
jgi:hypothetical protein